MTAMQVQLLCYAANLWIEIAGHLFGGLFETRV